MGIFDVLLQSKADTAYWKDCAIKAQRELQSVERRLLTVQEEGAIQALNMEGLHASAERLTTERDAAIARAEAAEARVRELEARNAQLTESGVAMVDRWDEECKAHARTRHERDALREERDSLKAEIAMLRGVDCGVDGDGPCGVCIKCARNSVDWCDAKFNGQGDE